MNIDRNIEFRFCTRTISERHRVFYDDGRETLSFTADNKILILPYIQGIRSRESNERFYAGL